MAYRQQGVGKELLKQELSFSEETGITCINLTVAATNTKAVSLYERAGFDKVQTLAAIVLEKEQLK